MRTRTLDGLRRIKEVVEEALGRCEHCGKEQPVFWCDECFQNKVEFCDAVTDVVSELEPDSDKRFLILLDLWIK